MKLFISGAALLILYGCTNTRTDGMYEGPAMNAKCALEVYPVEVAMEVKEMPVDSSIRKVDPLIRQGGLSVCREF